MRVGEALILRPPAGTIHGEAADPSVAAVTMPTLDTVVVTGIRPAETMLLLVNGATVLTQLLEVAPALAPAGTATGAAAPVGFVDLTYLPDTQAFWAELHRPGLDATVSSNAWQMHLRIGTLGVVGSSTLATPLQNFGAAPGWGMSVRTEGGWELVASATQSQVLYHQPLGGSNEVAIGASVAGALAALHVAGGSVGADVALLYQNGAAQAAGAIVVSAGHVQAGYAFGPQGGGPSIQLNERGWTLSAASGPQGLQIGAGVALSGSSRVNLWWSTQGGYGFGMTMPMGGAGTMSATGNTGAFFVGTNSPENPAGGVTTTSGFGAGQLTMTAPPPGFPALTPPVSSRLSPPGQSVWGPVYPTTPSYLRARLEIPAGAAAAPRAPASPAGPVSIPTGSAAVIVRACLHSASAKTTCDPGDPQLVVRVYLDGAPVEVGGVALPVPPGPHAIAIRPEDLPQFVVPLSPLTCPFTAVAGGVGVCEFAFRRAGTP